MLKMRKSCKKLSNIQKKSNRFINCSSKLKLNGIHQFRIKLNKKLFNKMALLK